MEKEKFEKKKKSFRGPICQFSQLVEHGEAWSSADMAKYTVHMISYEFR